MNCVTVYLIVKQNVWHLWTLETVRPCVSEESVPLILLVASTKKPRDTAKTHAKKRKIEKQTAQKYSAAQNL